LTMLPTVGWCNPSARRNQTGDRRVPKIALGAQ
jgi:hypothetical protein